MPATPEKSSKPNPKPASPLLGYLRLFRGGLHLVKGLAITLLLYPFAGAAGRRRHVRRWSAQLLKIFGVRLRVTGTPPVRGHAPLMLAANHVSWLDIFVILARLDVRFVSKSEVRQWPVIGTLSAGAGTLFLQRTRRTHLAQVNREIAQVLEDGEIVAIFPEGTSTDGTVVLPFHASLLEPAAVAGAAVQPVALRFTDGRGEVTTDAAYDGDKSLMDTLRLMVRHRTIGAELHFLPPVQSRGRTRRELAQILEKAVARALDLPLPKRRR